MGPRTASMFLFGLALGGPARAQAPAPTQAPAPAPARAPAAAERLVAAIDSNAMRAHLEVLAHDSLAGRGPGTRGGTRAGDYIAAQFQRLGLAPAGDGGSYFHHFGYSVIRTLRSSVRVGAHGLRYGVEQAVTIAGTTAEARLRGPAVFAGYGMSTPGRDAYGGQRVDGKVVVVLAGVPAGSAGLPESYASRTYKAAEAARRGAVATLVIHRDDLAGYPWSEIAGYWRDSHPRLDPPGTPSGSAVVSGWLSHAAGTKILRSGGLDLDQAVARSNADSAGPIDLPLVLEVEVSNRVESVRGRNVVGRIGGAGPQADEQVVVGAHYDALGIGPAVEGDSIYNGAEDNAGGTAQLLAVAEAFAASGVPTGRSLLFVAFDAEEAGLLGAEAFVARPPVPISSQVAMINMDGANLYGATRDVAALGLGYSTLDGPWRRAARAEGLTAPAAQPDSIEAFFLRSDQLPFARAGVPSTFVFVGWDFVGRPPEWASRMWSQYFERHYHRPSDQMQAWFSMAGATQQARMVARLALEVADAAERPAWVPGSPFAPE